MTTDDQYYTTRPTLPMPSGEEVAEQRRRDALKPARPPGWCPCGILTAMCRYHAGNPKYE